MVWLKALGSGMKFLVCPALGAGWIHGSVNRESLKSPPQNRISHYDVSFRFGLGV